ncbi:uncharacterized protein LOC113207730 isoform X1 [Frankliniella occidentalis]|uniref:Uncharacterized protein LOC113207730 isoform X1 n=1 Tax=Frankliniella occidentalis TaxID=133901 RepID=A0A6J1SLJ4_FRAOC|nr:uncharacterized protein LOC113207730 isoform X1 [Frankliniella occidentalis]
MAAHAQQQSGMHLLLMSEQTVPRTVFERERALHLDLLQTADERLAFRGLLHLTTTSSNSNTPAVGLLLKVYVATCPLIVHVKMTCGNYGSSQLPEPAQPTQPDQPTPPLATEAHVLVLASKYFPDVVSRLPLRRAFAKVTLTFTVYALWTPPAAGAGLHLNRARLQGSHCDVKLVVEGVGLDAHRAVLAARSPVLDAMLSGDNFKEAREGRVDLVDFSIGAVKKFLEYVYTNEVNDWDDDELEILQLADKYEVPDLVTECSQRLWKSGALQALRVLWAEADAHCQVIDGALRQRLTTTVVDNLKDLDNSWTWIEFRATHPFLADIILGSAAATRAPSTTSCVWTPQ